MKAVKIDNTSFNLLKANGYDVFKDKNGYWVKVKNMEELDEIEECIYMQELMDEMLENYSDDIIFDDND